MTKPRYPGNRTQRALRNQQAPTIKSKYKLRLDGKDQNGNDRIMLINKADYDLYTRLGVLTIVKASNKQVIVAVSERCKATYYNGQKHLKPEISTRARAWQEPQTEIEEKYHEPGKLHLCADAPAELAFTGDGWFQSPDSGNRFDHYELFNLIERELSNDAANDLRSRLGDMIRQYGEAERTVAA